MGKCEASAYMQPHITVCEGCIHNDVCGDKGYLSENHCSNRKEAPTITHWISVADDLPAEGQKVIVLCGDKAIEAYICVIKKIFVIDGLLFGYVTPDSNGDLSITHWIPKPVS